MTVVNTVQFKTWHGDLKHIELLHPERELLGHGFEMSLITGKMVLTRVRFSIKLYLTWWLARSL
jgi:hypothetical protein